MHAYRFVYFCYSLLLSPYNSFVSTYSYLHNYQFPLDYLSTYLSIYLSYPVYLSLQLCHHFYLLVCLSVCLYICIYPTLWLYWNTKINTFTDWCTYKHSCILYTYMCKHTHTHTHTHVCVRFLFCSDLFIYISIHHILSTSMYLSCSLHIYLLIYLWSHLSINFLDWILMC